MTRLLALVVVAVLSQGTASQTFTGVITDSMCEKDHSQMRMGPTDADCTRACVAAHGAAYVLFDGTDVYELSDQQQPEAFAGGKVRVVGRLDAAKKLIVVESMTAAD
ncbi:MAG: hypothetical protein A3F70_16550 [Acidobacteria bacterium RIFCSPLOWO2_12_FULL_67_14]|nr:MAG: hypothetical protein A3H29_19780 [Acidobacteria bacterium RIFCSPLOWO2_02_FULL_67_21]OFW40804.1 MAG: hypothetical protein A3F70_16550 [Acidobacteria bacterium RIFCSPLOWO2_12_FULL_67_14]